MERHWECRSGRPTELQNSAAGQGETESLLDIGVKHILLVLCSFLRSHLNFFAPPFRQWILRRISARGLPAEKTSVLGRFSAAEFRSFPRADEESKFVTQKHRLRRRWGLGEIGRKVKAFAFCFHVCEKKRGWDRRLRPQRREPVKRQQTIANRKRPEFRPRANKHRRSSPKCAVFFWGSFRKQRGRRKESSPFSHKPVIVHLLRSKSEVPTPNVHARLTDRESNKHRSLFVMFDSTLWKLSVHSKH